MTKQELQNEITMKITNIERCQKFADHARTLTEKEFYERRVTILVKELEKMQEQLKLIGNE